MGILIIELNKVEYYFMLYLSSFPDQYQKDINLKSFHIQGLLFYQYYSLLDDTKPPNRTHINCIAEL